jgi:hypothetical protein
MAACARPVLHEYLLLPGFRELWRHEARERVGTAARREGHDDAYRLRGKGLGGGDERKKQ